MIRLLLSVLVVVAFFGDSSFAETFQSQVTNFSNRIIPFNNQHQQVIVSAIDNEKKLQINYELKEQDLYIECSIKDFNFNRDKVGLIKKEGEGHIQLYINDIKVDSIFQPAFIIKSLPKGTYRIKLKLVHNDLSPYGIEEEFEITI